MSLEDAITAAVTAAVAPLAAEVRRLTAEIEQLRRAVPAPMLPASKAAKLLGLDKRTVIARVRDGRLPGREVGGKVLVDMAAVRHAPSDDEVARAAALITAPDHR
jgi:excisionase family DNA binding protein